MSTFGSLGISVSGMLASQAGLDNAGNNIANVNTPGYSRKVVEYQEGVVSTAPGTSKQRAYTGVVVDNIRRIRDLFLDNQIREQNSVLGYNKSISDLTIAMNDALGEPSDTGLTAKLNQFFQATKDLATSPNLDTAKTVFINSASALADSFNQIDTSIGLLKENLDASPTGQIESSVSQLNSLLTELSDVNIQAIASEGRGVIANDLEDKRDLLLDKISSLYQFNVIRNGDGTFSKLTVNRHTSEAKVVATTGSLNFDSAISGITSSTNTLTFSVDNGNGIATGPMTVNFEANSSMRDVVDKINKTFNAAGGKGTVASVDSNGRLSLSTSLIDNSLNTDDAEIDITGGTALTALGLSVGTTNGSDGIKTTVLDGAGLHYVFDVQPGNNNVNSFASTLILRTNDAVLSSVGSIDDVGGSIGGLLRMSNKDIPAMRKMLDEFAMSLKKGVNDLLSLGTTSSGTQGATLFTGTTAGDLAINTNAISNPSIIAQGASGNVSDGSIAAEIADLFFGDNNIISNGSQTEMVYIDSSSSSSVQSAVPVIPGEQITIHADGIITDGSSAVNAGDNGFGSGSLVQIEFLNAAGTVIGSTTNFPTADGAPNDRVSYSGTVPTGAAFVRFKMNSSTFNDNDITNNTGHFKLSVIQGSESDAAANFNSRISNIVGDFGTRGNIANSKLENTQSLRDSLDNRRQSVMGVSLEEEASDLIRFQNAFAANANVIRVMSEVLQTLTSIL